MMTNKNTFRAIAAAIAAFFLLIFPALAQESITRPIYFKVVGVADSDVLNVRAGPSAGSDILTGLAYNASPVEVFEVRDGWAQVALGEGMGWVSMHFLDKIELSNIEKTALPEGISCGGTEPFWNLVMADGRVEYSALGEDDTSFTIFEAGQFQNVGRSVNFVLAQASGAQFTGIVSNQLCSDGMSDRDYLRRIEILLSSPEGTVGQSGCCKVSIAQ